jgi:hypothetical protein
LFFVLHLFFFRDSCPEGLSPSKVTPPQFRFLHRTNLCLAGELCRRFRDSLAADSWSGSSVHSIATGFHWFVLVLAPVFESLTGTAVGVSTRLGFLRR